MPKSRNAADAADPAKMADYFYSPEARLDLLEIWEYIARDSLDAADRLEREVQQAVSMLLTARPHGFRQESSQQ